MTAGTLLVTAPVVLPLLGAGASLLLGPFPTAQRILGVTVVTAVLVDAALLLVRVDRSGAQVAHVGGFPPPVGITLVADRLAALVLLVAVAVVLVVLAYAISEGLAEWRPEHVPSVFQPTYLVLMAGIALAFLTGDLFTLFVGLEVMLMASYVLITLGATTERVRAGMTYITASLTASIMLLTTIGLTYAVTGTVNLAQLSLLVPELPAGLRALLGLMLLLVLGIKAAMVPMHWWLPDSYPTAPAPVTAIFAALLTKVAVYAIIRTQTLLFPRPDPWLLLLVLAAATMLVGILGALVQDDLNRALSFVLVSHIGYMLFGLAVFSVAGLTGAVLYLVHHITVQTSLFLVSGLIEWRQRTMSLARLGGLAVTAPLLTALLFVPALSVAGIPPLAGFVGKLALLQAAVARPTPAVLTVAAISLVTSLLTLAAMARVWLLACWRPAPPVAAGARGNAPAAAGGGPPHPEPSPRDLAGEVPAPAGGRGASRALGGATGSERAHPRPMLAAAAAAVLLGLAVAAAAGPLAAVSQRAATDLIDRAPYREAVLGEGTR